MALFFLSHEPTSVRLVFTLTVIKNIEGLSGGPVVGLQASTVGEI